MSMDDLVRLADGARTARRSLRWMVAAVARGNALVDSEYPLENVNIFSSFSIFCYLKIKLPFPPQFRDTENLL
jgi:hypothetical protein